MKIGYMTPSFEGYPPIDVVARALEDRGFESLWVGEHSHLPLATVNPYIRDGSVPPMYRIFLDPFVMLAVAAAVTTKIRLGTAVVLAAERSVLHLAKEVGTLDLVSSGRFEFGVGYGWNPLEAQNNGVDPEQRREVLREKVLAMKRLWQDGHASFEGEFVSFSDSWTAPSPIQKPHPPILIGAAANRFAVAHVAEFADGWMPNLASTRGRLVEDLAKVRRATEEAGRDPASIEVTLIASVLGSGTVDEKLKRIVPREQLEELVALGVHRVVLGAGLHEVSDLMYMLDALAPLNELVAA